MATEFQGDAGWRDWVPITHEADLLTRLDVAVRCITARDRRQSAGARPTRWGYNRRERHSRRHLAEDLAAAGGWETAEYWTRTLRPEPAWT